MVAAYMRQGPLTEAVVTEIARTHHVSPRMVFVWRKEIIDAWKAEADLLGDSGQRADILARVRQDALDAKAAGEFPSVIAARKLEAEILGIIRQPPGAQVLVNVQVDPRIAAMSDEELRQIVEVEG